MQMDANRIYRDLIGAVDSNLRVDPVDVLAALEEHRTYWRPSNVRVILLAESHVRTSEMETTHAVVLRGFSRLSIPKPFVRLVYCLGYGENAVVDPPLVQNSGTPQYWGLFWACLNDPKIPETYHAGPLKKSHGNLQERIKSKIALLSELKARGIWLLDASLIALYGHQKKPRQKAIRSAIEASWNLHVKETILNARPAAVVIIGRTVFNILSEHLLRLKLEELTWIYQPGAFTTSERKVQDRMTLYRICNSYAAKAW